MSKSAKDIQAELKAYLSGKSAVELATSDDRVIGLLRGNRIKAKNAEVQQKKSNTIKQQYADPSYKEYRHSILKESTKTEKFKQAHAKGMTKREENGWLEKNREAAKKKYKPIHTPHGEFLSKNAAIEHMTSIGIGNANGKLSNWLKTKPEEYYYIAKTDK